MFCCLWDRNTKLQNITRRFSNTSTSTSSNFMPSQYHRISPYVPHRTTGVPYRSAKQTPAGGRPAGSGFAAAATKKDTLCSFRRLVALTSTMRFASRSALPLSVTRSERQTLAGYRRTLAVPKRVSTMDPTIPSICIIYHGGTVGVQHHMHSCEVFSSVACGELSRFCICLCSQEP